MLARRGLIAGALAALAAEYVLLALWQRNGYWDFSDGVYALSARELLHGGGLYSAFAGAQPPPVYLVGAGLLAIHDGLASLRTGMALAELATALLVGFAALRLSNRRALALAAALASPLLPIELHEHAQLIPETIAAPLLMAGALLAARPGRSAWTGVALALAVACKLAFVVPALAIVLAGADRRRTGAAFLASGAILAGASLAGYGTALWTETVRAQLEVGTASLHYVGGLLAQAAWNELPLLVLAAPLVLDLLLFADLAQRAGMRGIQEWLSFYFKSPQSAPGVYPEHDLFIQLTKLKNTLRFLAGEEPITHLGLEYYDYFS